MADSLKRIIAFSNLTLLKYLFIRQTHFNEKLIKQKTHQKGGF